VDGWAIEPIWSCMMHDRLRTAARFVDTRVGWSRVGFVLSVAVITAAAVVLYQVLRDIRIADVIDALGDIETSNIIFAALFVAAGYFTLTFYDLFALRTIGRKAVPYRIAALAAFTSYAIGHNLGASVFTGGAVRYRIYSAYGLSGIDVAKLCFITGLTFWLGNATVLGLGLLVVPGAASSVD
jgi:glycosyltransferase 2 family protein